MVCKIIDDYCIFFKGQNKPINSIEYQRWRTVKSLTKQYYIRQIKLTFYGKNFAKDVLILSAFSNIGLEMK